MLVDGSFARDRLSIEDLDVSPRTPSIIGHFRRDYSHVDGCRVWLKADVGHGRDAAQSLYLGALPPRLLQLRLLIQPRELDTDRTRVLWPLLFGIGHLNPADAKETELSEPEAG